MDYGRLLPLETNSTHRLLIANPNEGPMLAAGVSNPDGSKSVAAFYSRNGQICFSDLRVFDLGASYTSTVLLILRQEAGRWLPADETRTMASTKDVDGMAITRAGATIAWNTQKYRAYVYGGADSLGKKHMMSDILKLELGTGLSVRVAAKTI